MLARDRAESPKRCRFCCSQTTTSPAPGAAGRASMPPVRCFLWLAWVMGRSNKSWRPLPPAYAGRRPVGTRCIRVRTQDLIDNMLGVRRKGVTEAAGKLQRAGLINYSRGHIPVLDRTGLEARVGECYEVVRKESHHPPQADHPAAEEADPGLAPALDAPLRAVLPGRQHLRSPGCGGGETQLLGGLGAIQRAVGEHAHQGPGAPGH
jgi:hypothetical protein